MKHLLALVILVPTLVACKSADDKPANAAGKGAAKPLAAETSAEPPDTAAVACDPGAAELTKQLSDANGYNMDLSTPEAQKKIDAATAAIAGKTFAFSNCLFSSQGNDEVSFKATADADDDLACVMKGGEDGNKAFRNAAMKFDMDKLRLDVRGTIKEHGDRKKLALVDCEITPHE